ncbi:FAD-binding protein [Agromyces sp. G08B096]|uniref:FAD-binding protein n=1 Tax=Agromyces sp. G08B096 TaxID=3156399 RepID=A0AAU7W7F1_9MICO
MSLELGVLIEPDWVAGPGPGASAGAADRPDPTTELTRAAEAAGLDLVVLTTGRDAPESGLDPWTTAVWLAARTTRIAIGVAESRTARTPLDAEAPVPSMLARGREAADVLAPGRLITARPDQGAGRPWVVAAADAGADDLAALAEAGLPVVVPARTLDDVARLGAIAAELRTRVPAAPRRSVAVRARRVAGIDYDGVPESLAARAVEPGDAAFRRVSSTYLRGGAPGLVLRPRSVEEVADAVGFAARHPGVQLGIRSGGHGISGRSTNRGGIVIDVGALDGIEVLDRARRLVRIGPGATWKRVAAALQPYGWALGSGDYGGVGVGGLATAGGIGLLSRAHGLTIDHLRAVELVLADGTWVRASAEEHPDLFWAVRGAGANFGIATAFEFEVDEVGEVGWAKLALVTPDLEGSLRDFGRLASGAPRDTTVFLVTGAPREGQSVLQLYAMVDDDRPDEIVERLTPFTSLGLLAQQQAAVMPYRDVMAEAADVGPDGHHGAGEPVSRSAFLPELTPAFARDTARLLERGLVSFFQLRTMGGAIADVPSDATAFAHRTVGFQVTAMGPDDEALRDAWRGLRRHFDGLYLSFETSRDPQALPDAFPEPTLGRLRELKRRYDPGSVFRDNFFIDPAAAEAATPTRLEAAS